MRCDQELKIGQCFCQDGEYIHLPLWMQMQINLIHHDNPSVFDQLLLVWTGAHDMEQEISNPSQVRAITVG